MRAPSPRWGEGGGEGSSDQSRALNPSPRPLPSGEREKKEQKLVQPMSRVVLLFAIGVVVAAAQAYAQAPGDRGELRGLKLGLDARAMPTTGFGEFACGSNGGP